MQKLDDYIEKQAKGINKFSDIIADRLKKKTDTEQSINKIIESKQDIKQLGISYWMLIKGLELFNWLKQKCGL